MTPSKEELSALVGAHAMTRNVSSDRVRDWSSEGERQAVKCGEKAAYEYTGGKIGVFLAGLTAYRQHLSAIEAPAAPSEVTEALKRAVAILDGELGSSWGERNHADWSFITAALKGGK